MIGSAGLTDRAELVRLDFGDLGDLGERGGFVFLIFIFRMA